MQTSSDPLIPYMGNVDADVPVRVCVSEPWRAPAVVFTAGERGWKSVRVTYVCVCVCVCVRVCVCLSVRA